MVFGAPDIEVKKLKDGELQVELGGLDVYDPTAQEVRNSSTDDVACWFIDTAHKEQAKPPAPHEKLQTPSTRSRTHPAQTPSEPAAFVAGRKKFVCPDSPGATAQIPNGFHRLIGLRLLPIGFRHDPGDGASVPGDDESLAPFDIIEQSGKMSFRL
jgi:hypothetical protein